MFQQLTGVFYRSLQRENKWITRNANASAAAEVGLTSLLASVCACCRQVRFCSHPSFDTIVSKTSALSSSASAPRRLKMNIWEGKLRYWLGGTTSLSDGDGNIAPHQPKKKRLVGGRGLTLRVHLHLSDSWWDAMSASPHPNSDLWIPSHLSAVVGYKTVALLFIQPLKPNSSRSSRGMDSGVSMFSLCWRC